MKGDFTRVTFDPTKHYSRVLMQQGRVQLDADWNEQAAILLHYLETLATDLIGPFGGPAGEHHGFKVSPASNAFDFAISRGRYYVDGVLCENENETTTYLTQKYYRDNYPDDARSKLPGGVYLAYLDVWEHHVTWLEDEHVREVALGGPDTATRAKIVWQVKITDTQPNGDSRIPAGWGRDNVFKVWDQYVAAWRAQSRCELKVRLKPDQANTDPCTIAPSSAYRGQENQLYRVEIHQGGNAEDATFKWSRDNGSTVAAWVGSSDDDKLILSSVRGFANAPWVEITSADDDLHGVFGELFQVINIEGDALQVQDAPTWNESPPKKVRRWDQQENEIVTLKSGAVPLKEGTAETDWIDLEDGIQVQFQPPDPNAPNRPNHYRTGDYWLIPARTNGMIEWPPELKNSGEPQVDAEGNVIPLALAPLGIEHHYAPLCLVTVKADGAISIAPSGDLHREFPPAAAK